MASLVNLWQVCPKWHVAFTAVPILLYVFGPNRIYIYIYIYIHTHTHTHTYISDCKDTVHELMLLPNNTACDIFLHKSGVVCSVHWIFITGAPAWLWLCEYVTLGKMFYNPCNKLQIQVSKWEPDKQQLPSTTAVAVFLTTFQWLALELSAHTLSIVLWVDSLYLLKNTCRRQ